LHRVASRRLAGFADAPQSIEIWLAGEWKPLAQSESKEITKRQAGGERHFEIACKGYRYKIDLDHMTQTNTRTGRTRTLRYVDANPNAPKGSPMGFESFRKAFHDHAPGASLREAALVDSWPLDGERHPVLVDLTVGAMLRSMRLRGQSDVDLTEWSHYWALERDSPSFRAGADVNEKLAAALKRDARVLGRMQMHYETSLHESHATGGLTGDGLVRVCERLVKSPEQTIEQKWAAEVLEKRDRGEAVAEEDAELSYFDFLNVMLGRKRYKVSLWMYDISDGLAGRWSWLLLGKQFDGIWHSGLVVEFPDRTSEFWFGGKLFDSAAGTTPFGEPMEKRCLGYTYKTRDEIRNHMARYLAVEYSRDNYDVLTHNCNHFCDSLAIFLMNEHIPDDVVHQADQVMETTTATLLRPFLNRWLGGFGDSATVASSQVDTHELDAVDPGALVEFCRAEGGRPLVGEVAEVGGQECTVRCLDYWQRGICEWCVPRSLVTRVLLPAKPHRISGPPGS